MRESAQSRFRVSAITGFLLLLLVPTVASAGWGDENWGEMVWGGVFQIPAMTAGGVVVVAIVFLGLSYWLLAARRRRAKRPPLKP